MILAWIIGIFLGGGLLAWFLNRWDTLWPRWVSLITLTTNLTLLLIIWFGHIGSPDLSANGFWLIEMNMEWISRLGINFHLSIDGLSLLLIFLTTFLGIMAVIASWTEIKERVGFFHFNLMWVLAGITGVFMSLDMFLFYFFWEMMLVPMYFIIAFWGHENRIYAAVKFFLFTQASGLLMLIAILSLYVIHGHQTGTYTFDYMQLLGTHLTASTAMLLMLGFFIAFAVKLPIVPFHTWLPDAHTEAPTAGSVILAGLLLKTGAYGLIRFVLPLFPVSVLDIAPVVMVLAVIGIIYSAVLAFAQSDIKRLVAYTSISHMGFVLLGIFTGNELALQGAVLQIICHGLSTGALFILVGSLHERIHTRDMRRMGGLWATAPRMGGMGIFFALASLGLPGLGNFIAEVLILIGSYKVSIPLTVVAATGLITSTIYSLWFVQRTFHGSNTENWKIPDFSNREMSMMLAMAFILLWLGLYPQPVISSARQSLNNLNRIVTKTGLKVLQKDIKGLEGTHLMQVEQAKDKHLQSLKEPGDRP